MKAHIDENGKIRIYPESPVETYAMKVWLQQNAINVDDLLRQEGTHYRASGLIFSLSPEAPE